ncbi:MAG: hypothetical protein DLM73_10165 [Chthoniobacterales bacterium]|nr:MAG: hypothetical protein DLM73_10165 [Chthoniobacterales bacterium]
MRTGLHQRLSLPLLLGYFAIATLAPGAEPEKLGDLRGVEQAHFNQDGSRVVVRLRGGQTTLWDAAAGTLVPGDLGSNTISEALVVSSDSKLVLLGFKDGHSRVFDANSASFVSPVLDAGLHAQLRTPALFSPDGTMVAVFADKELKLFNVRSGERITTIPLTPGTNDDAPGSALFTSNGAECFVMDGGGSVTRYETKNWKPAGKPMRHPAAKLAYEFFFNASDDGKWVVTFDDAGENGPEGNLQVWDAVASKQVGKPLVAVNGFEGRFFGTNRIVIMPARGQANVRELPSMKILYALRPHDELDGPKVDLSPDNKWLITWGPDKRLDLFDAATGKLANNYLSSAAVGKVVMSPGSSACYVLFDNSAFLVEGHYDNYVVKLSFPDLKVAGLIRVLDYVANVALSPDGRRLLIHQGKTDQERLLFFDAATLKPIESAKP